MGLDPALAVRLRVGEEAAAKLAAIPDTEALRSADLAITRSGLNDYGEAHSTFVAEIERLAAIYCEGVQPNFANASLAELLAFCVATEKLAPAIKSEDTAQILPALRALERVPRVPKPEHREGCCHEPNGLNTPQRSCVARHRLSGRLHLEDARYQSRISSPVQNSTS
jgi:hypothetical protein